MGSRARTGSQQRHLTQACRVLCDNRPLSNGWRLVRGPARARRVALLPSRERVVPSPGCVIVRRRGCAVVAYRRAFRNGTAALMPAALAPDFISSGSNTATTTSFSSAALQPVAEGRVVHLEDHDSAGRPAAASTPPAPSRFVRRALRGQVAHHQPVEQVSFARHTMCAA